MTYFVVVGVLNVALIVGGVALYRRARTAELAEGAAKALLEVERAKGVEDAEKARPFVDLERDAWTAYEARVIAARDIYNTALSQIQAYRDAGIRERAERRFLEKQAELLKGTGLQRAQ